MSALPPAARSAAPAITEETPFAVLRRTWQPVGLSRLLQAGGVLGYRLLGEEIVVARFPDGRLLAAPDACPHKGVQLSCGRVEGDRIVCPYHGWAFGADGACVGIPSLPDPPQRLLDHAALRAFAVQERYGMIWVALDAPIASLPDLPEFEGHGGWDVLVPDPMPFACGFRREIENYLDMTHFSFAHGTTLGLAADVVLPPLDIRRLPDGGFEMHAPFPALRAPGVAPGKLQSAHDRRQRCYLPNITTIRQTFEDGDERMVVHVPSPNSPTSCTVFWALAQPRAFRGPALLEQVPFSTQVLEEDRYMCERQRPREVPVAPGRGGWGVLVAPGDTLANTYQKCFRSFLDAHA